jgi:type IV secretory pathway VirB6-like protein
MLFILGLGIILYYFYKAHLKHQRDMAEKTVKSASKIDPEDIFGKASEALNHAEDLLEEQKKAGATPETLKPLADRIGLLQKVVNNEWWLQYVVTEDTIKWVMKLIK